MKCKTAILLSGSTIILGLSTWAYFKIKSNYSKYEKEMSLKKTKELETQLENTRKQRNILFAVVGFTSVGLLLGIYIKNRLKKIHN